MFNIDFQARLRNKVFWVAMISAVALLIQQLGFNILLSNYSGTVNSVLTILTMIGIIVDTSTPGISDKTITIEKSDSKENKTI